MQTSQNGINLIKKFEGVRLKAYKPVKTEQYWTIGYGHYGADVAQNMEITQEQAEQYLKQDLKKFENYVNNKKLDLNQNQFDALVSFTYNCGPGSLNTLCNGRSIDQIGNALKLYNKAGGKTLAGLVKRRQQEMDLFFTASSMAQINEQKEPEKTETNNSGLPYKVRTKAALNIRTGAGTKYDSLRIVPKGTILTAWAELTLNAVKWGKNGKEYFCLSYCEKI